MSWIEERADQMAAETIQLADLNSGSDNLAGLDRVLTELDSRFQRLGGIHEFVDLPPYDDTEDSGAVVQRHVGRALRIRKEGSAPVSVLLVGHYDTVFGADHPFQTTRLVDEHTINGPGVCDMKAGLVIMLNALESFERSKVADTLDWEVILNPDEELGSLSSAGLLRSAAREHTVGLIFEAALPDGNLVSARAGSGNFDLVVKGREAHAGRSPGDGRNAVISAADLIAKVDSLDSKGVSINVGYVHGGGPVNIVPATTVVKLNVRVADKAQADYVESELRLIAEAASEREGFSAELRGGFTRPPKILDSRTEALLKAFRQAGLEQGLDLEWAPTAGVSDGNLLAAEHLPTVDSLGGRGGALHSPQEFLDLRSLPERAKLTSSFLELLAGEEVFA